jgi:hypothetical protein
MRQLLTILLVLIACTCARAQINGFLKATGIPYFDQVPTYTPNTATGFELAWVVDSQRLYFWDRDQAAWEPYAPGEASGGGGIEFGSGLTGAGTLADKVRVDTSLISTINNVTTTVLAYGQQTVKLNALGGETTLVIPFQIDTSRPILFTRNGQGLEIGTEVTLSGTTFTIQGPALEAGERIAAFLFELQ